MKFIKFTAMVLASTLAFAASAHVSLTDSMPAQNAMLMQSPEQLSLTFSGKVRLAKVTVNTTDKRNINFGFKPVAEANTHFSWALPTLAQGNYRVNWIALGADGHKMSGTLDFMVHHSDANADNKAHKGDADTKHKH